MSNVWCPWHPALGGSQRSHLGTRSGVGQKNILTDNSWESWVHDTQATCRGKLEPPAGATPLRPVFLWDRIVLSIFLISLLWAYLSHIIMMRT